MGSPPISTGVIQDVGKTFKTGPRILGARWLLNPQRRKGKTTSSIVVFLQSAVKNSGGYIRIRGRRHSVEVYEFDRKHKKDMPYWSRV
jgi:hypothetical protein